MNTGSEVAYYGAHLVLVVLAGGGGDCLGHVYTHLVGNIAADFDWDIQNNLRENM